MFWEAYHIQGFWKGGEIYPLPPTSTMGQTGVIQSQILLACISFIIAFTGFLCTGRCQLYLLTSPYKSNWGHKITNFVFFIFTLQSLRAVVLFLPMVSRWAFRRAAVVWVCSRKRLSRLYLRKHKV